MAFLRIKDLVKEFPSSSGRPLRVLDGINLDVKKREFVAIFGPNGCGKTTLLKIISGFEAATNGEVQIRSAPAEKAKSYLVLQNPDESLFNWMTTRGNIEIALNDEQKIDSILENIRVGGKTLLEFSKHYPYQLSGGLKQLTVIARAMAFSPSVLLLDEPFSSLDFRTAMQMEDSLLDIWEKSKQTVLFVSHNVEEAVYLSDRIVLLSNQPTKVETIINIELPRPRRYQMRFSSSFQKIEKKVLESFCGCG